jgi:glutamine synthetase
LLLLKDKKDNLNMYCSDKHKAVIEYIWIDGIDNIRSKIRVMHNISNINSNMFEDLIWNYDGSSTNQANSDGDSEVILQPCFICKNPLKKNDNNCQNYILLCETLDSLGNPLPSNTRHLSAELFNASSENYEPWFGLEQEYFLMNDNIRKSIDKLMANNPEFKQSSNTTHYCGKSIIHDERIIAETHLNACIEAGLTISGINSEVSFFQWEFQIGPVEGILAADSLIVARFLLERIAEKYGYEICYEPKPYKKLNGSGCHINFSTKKMRDTNGIEEIYKSIQKLETKHTEHIAVYGKNNEMRLTGKHETANIHTFTHGVGTRNTSIRIPNSVAKNGYGYFEDRRPASNVDPYLSTSIIFKTCCLD